MAVTSTKNLRKGSSGSDVLDLQKRLNNTGYGYNLAEDGVFGDKTLAAVQDYQKRSGLTVDGIVGTNTWSKLTGAQNPSTTTPAQTEVTAPTFDYTKSDTVAQKEAQVEQHNAQKPGDFSYSLQAGWDDIMNQIINGEKFSYDLNGDMLYQQYKDQYNTQGKLAMMDTMGQAAAMTGGYGNSYAQTAGQQAYQGYLQQLNDKVPELYQLALDQYNRDRQDLYNQYSMYADKHNQEYGKHRDTVTDWKDERNYLAEDARHASQTDYDQAMDKFNIDYGTYRDTVGDDQWQATFDEGVRQFDVDQEYKREQDAISNDIAYKKLQKELEGSDPITPDYSDWDAGDWEAYFATIRKTEGKAAAEEELNYFTRNGLIPTNMVTHAASGARGGQMGH